MIKPYVLHASEPAMNEPITRQPALMEMADIARAFSMSLVDSINEIETLLDQRIQTEQLERLSSAIHIAHKIRGCAGTLGFDTVGSAFAVMEDQLRLIEINRLLRHPAAMTAIASTIALCRTLVQCQKNESLITGETPVFHIAPM